LNTNLQFGEIVLIKFPYTNNIGYAKRPALVILDTNDKDIVLCRITSILHSSEFDVPVTNWSNAGLLSSSIIRVHKIATIQKRLIEKK